MDFTTILIFVLTIGVLIVSLILTVYHARINLFQPVVVAGSMFIIFFLFDILYILFDEDDSFNLSGKTFYYGDYQLPIFVILISILFWYFGDHLGITNYRHDKSNQNFYINSEDRFRYVLTISIFTFGALIVQTILLFRFIKNVGGLNFYLEHIADRALIFNDATIFYASIQATTTIASILVGYFLSIIKNRKANLLFKFIVILIIMLVVSLGILTGARANILKSIVIVLITYNFFGRKIKLNFRLISFFIVLALFFVVFAQVTRNLETKNVGIIDSVYDGVEISQVNNILILEQRNMMSSEHGSTIMAGLGSFIPGFIYDAFNFEKLVGANAKFTESIWFERWIRSQSEIALGFLGEISLNFGLFFMPIYCFLTGFLYRKIYNFLVIKRSLGYFGLVLYVGIVWSIFQLLRGDLFNTILNFFIYAAGCFIAFSLIKFSMMREKANSSNNKLSRKLVFR